MELVVLGSGSAFAAGSRAQSGYLLHHEGTRVLIDAGPGTLANLVRSGHRPEQLDAIFLTHWHPDHVSDLVPVLFQARYSGAKRETDLPIHGPSTFVGVYDALMSVFGQWCVGETYDLVPVELERERVEIGALAVTAFPVRHNVPAIGYRVTDGVAHVAFTGDTGAYEGLTDLARGADVLVSDATLAPGDTYDAHLTARQAGELAARAGVRTLLLSHLPPDVETRDPVSEARAVFDGQVALAQDLLAIALDGTGGGAR